MTLSWTDAISGAARRMTRAQLDAELSPSRFVSSLEDELALYARRSAAARAAAAERGRLHEGLRYGPGDDAVLDLLRPDGAAPAPLVIYVHGGFWQQLSRRESAFAAAGLNARGAALAAVGYTLAPAATLAEIVAQVRAAVRYLLENADQLGLDRTRFVIAGSSAGAHLAAMALMDGDDALPSDALCGACLVSGVYDLRAVCLSYVNDVVRIDAAQEAALSPSRCALAVDCPIALLVGQNEPDEFHRETRQFADVLARAGRLVAPLYVADRHHFDVILDLEHAATHLGHTALSMLGLIHGANG